MSLTLTIRNCERLDNGAPTEFVLNRRGALLGRSPTCDWSLPDSRNFISSKHAEIRFEGDFYTFHDISMNGTLLNGAGDRMTGARRIEHGDVFVIGQYEVVASLSGAAVAALERESDEVRAAARSHDWGGWDKFGGERAPPSQASAHEGQGPRNSEASVGWNSGSAPAAGPLAPSASEGPLGGGWTPDRHAPMRGTSTWGAPPPAPNPASGWSSAAPDRPPAPTPDDVWGRIAEGNVVDWARAGFGQPAPPARDPLGLGGDSRRPSPESSREPPRASGGWAEPAPAAASDWAAPTAVPPAPPHPAAKPPPPSGTGMASFLAGAGLQPSQVKQGGESALNLAGQLVARLVAGLVLMLEARARAKSQMGAEATSFSFDGNNPLKFARTPEEAVAALLNEPVRGMMSADRAIEDAFHDLQSHQMATLKAMQGALRATLDRFSPGAIRKRAESGGFLAKILPGAKDAALWQAYEREFGGVAQGSDEAFMDVFAKEFRRAYDEQGRDQPKRR